MGDIDLENDDAGAVDEASDDEEHKSK